MIKEGNRKAIVALGIVAIVSTALVLVAIFAPDELTVIVGALGTIGTLVGGHFGWTNIREHQIKTKSQSQSAQ